MHRRNGVSGIAALFIVTVAGLKAGSPRTAEQLTKGSDCFSCHAADHIIVGPAYNAIAKKYAAQPDAASRLVRRIREGGSGTWGNVRMPPHPTLTDAQTKEI